MVQRILLARCLRFTRCWHYSSYRVRTFFCLLWLLRSWNSHKNQTKTYFLNIKKQQRALVGTSCSNYSWTNISRTTWCSFHWMVIGVEKCFLNQKSPTSNQHFKWIKDKTSVWTVCIESWSIDYYIGLRFRSSRISENIRRIHHSSLYFWYFNRWLNRRSIKNISNCIL